MPLPVFIFSIRFKLLLVSLILLLIPWLGFNFIERMEAFLRTGQEESLTSTARAIAASLSDRPTLFARGLPSASAEAEEHRKIIALFGSSDPETAASLGTTYVPSEEIERLLNLVARTANRVWVIDAHARVRGLGGNLRNVNPVTPALPGKPDNLLSRLFSLIMAAPPDDPGDDPQLRSQAVMSQVDRALVGQPTAYWRYTKDRQSIILSAAQPVWLGDDIIAAVVVEETTGAIQILKANALQNLAVITLIVFGAGFVVLFVFAARLAVRVRRLSMAADRAIDAQGRIKNSLPSTFSRDEIGDLSRILSNMIARLQSYNSYLENMASRLSHELRTPVAVVRSSLDNLRQQTHPEEAKIYVERASEGVARLSGLIARLSEGTQLERFLQSAEKEVFDLTEVIAGCVQGYGAAYPAYRFELDSQHHLYMEGIPDAMAQLLDKLIDNAMDFSPPEKPILINLVRNDDTIVLTVSNSGPPLPDDMGATLFESMVSLREGSGNQKGHLGLGLYITRLIAEFHNGSVSARNIDDRSGVIFEICIPAAKKESVLEDIEKPPGSS